MKERARPEFSPRTCQHCQKELIPTSSTQKYHPDCGIEVKRTRRRERYHTDSDFKERTLKTKRQGQRKSHNELATLKLIDLLEVTTRYMGHFTSDSHPLFPVEEGMVMISPGGLRLKTEESDVPIKPKDAVGKYTYRRIKEAARKIMASDLRK